MGSSAVAADEPRTGPPRGWPRRRSRPPTRPVTLLSAREPWLPSRHVSSFRAVELPGRVEIIRRRAAYCAVRGNTHAYVQVRVRPPRGPRRAPGRGPAALASIEGG